ncbi:MAG: M20/M25/M40 family metallo-hydrolase [Microgenomates group bacterium]
MKNELLKILTKLVSFQTTNDQPENITKCFDYIDSQLSFYPFAKKIYIQNGVESRVWSTKKSLNTEYILNAHIDVVPADQKLFKLHLQQDKLNGRGVSDMKFSIASYICILKDIYTATKKLPSIALMLTSDEELGGYNGVNYLVNQIGYSASVVMVPDGGENNKIVENAKGVLHLQISSTGIPAHAARLWEGESAIEKLAQAIVNLRKIYPYPSKSVWKNTLNIGKIQGGTQTNQVPDSAFMYLDIRYLPTTNTDIVVKKIANACPNCQVKTIINGEAFHIDKNNKYISRWAKLISNGKQVYINENIASDGRYFSAKNIPVIVSKPIGGLIHHHDEWTSLSSLMEFTNNLKKFLTNDTD